MSASRFPIIWACALVGYIVRARAEAMNNHSNWCLLVFCSFIVSPFRFGKQHSSLDSVRASGLALRRVWRELLEHLRHTLVQVLFIFIGLAGEGVLGTAAPNQLLGFCVVHVDDQGSLFLVLFGCRGLAEPSAPESSPAPSTTHAVIEGLK